LHQLAVHLFHFFARLGGFGLLTLGILDSSFLFMPLGNDLLIIALTVRKHDMLPYYVVMAATGSVLGCLVVDLVCRKGGEQGLEKRLSPRRLQFIRRHVEEHAGWALAVASLMPPPFPFTPFVIGASALQYSRRKMLAVIAVTRTIRFTVAGLLAIFFGRRIIHWAGLPAVRYAILLLVAVSITGSLLSLLKWFRKSRTATAPSR
jgi:membrane protein DedA with SNARE-associated domain